MHNCIDFIASDAHNPKRAPAMKRAAEEIVRFSQEQMAMDAQASQALANRLLLEAPDILTRTLFAGKDDAKAE